MNNQQDKQNSFDFYRLLYLSQFKKNYLEKSLELKLNPDLTIMQYIREAEDGLNNFQRINMSYKSLTDDQIIPLLEALKNDKLVIDVDLSRNKLKNIQPLIDLVNANKVIKKVNITENCFEEIEILKLKKIIQLNNQLQEVFILNDMPKSCSTKNNYYLKCGINTDNNQEFKVKLENMHSSDGTQFLLDDQLEEANKKPKTMTTIMSLNLKLSKIYDEEASNSTHSTTLDHMQRSLNSLNSENSTRNKSSSNNAQNELQKEEVIKFLAEENKQQGKCVSSNIKNIGSFVNNKEGIVKAEYESGSANYPNSNLQSFVNVSTPKIPKPKCNSQVTNRNNSKGGRLLMSRMDWMMNLRKIFEESKRNEKTNCVELNVFLEKLMDKVKELPLKSEKIYIKQNKEKGFSCDEIIEVLKNYLQGSIRYDDIIDAIALTNLSNNPAFKSQIQGIPHSKNHKASRYASPKNGDNTNAERSITPINKRAKSKNQYEISSQSPSAKNLPQIPMSLSSRVSLTRDLNDKMTMKSMDNKGLDCGVINNNQKGNSCRVIQFNDDANQKCEKSLPLNLKNEKLNCNLKENIPPSVVNDLGESNSIKPAGRKMYVLDLFPNDNQGKNLELNQLQEDNDIDPEKTSFNDINQSIRVKSKAFTAFNNIIGKISNLTINSESSYYMNDSKIQNTSSYMLKNENSNMIFDQSNLEYNHSSEKNSSSLSSYISQSIPNQLPMKKSTTTTTQYQENSFAMNLKSIENLAIEQKNCIKFTSDKALNITAKFSDFNSLILDEIQQVNSNICDRQEVYEERVNHFEGKEFHDPNLQCMIMREITNKKSKNVSTIGNKNEDLRNNNQFPMKNYYNGQETQCNEQNKSMIPNINYDKNEKIEQNLIRENPRLECLSPQFVQNIKPRTKNLAIENNKIKNLKSTSNTNTKNFEKQPKINLKPVNAENPNNKKIELKKPSKLPLKKPQNNQINSSIQQAKSPSNEYSKQVDLYSLKGEPKTFVLDLRTPENPIQSSQECFINENNNAIKEILLAKNTKENLPNEEQINRFNDILTQLNTFYNENNIMLTETDIKIIQKINDYSQFEVMTPSSNINNQYLIGLKFQNLPNNVEELVVFPLMKSILQYIQAFAIIKSNITQDILTHIIPENIKILNLSYNNLGDIRCLGQCRNLEFINLSHNQIEEVKGFIMCLKLREINLSYNKIWMIKNLSKLSELQVLDLSYNLIKTIDALDNLKSNSKLKYLNLHENQVLETQSFMQKIFVIIPSLQYAPNNISMEEISDFADFREFTWREDCEENIRSLSLNNRISMTNVRPNTPKSIMRGSSQFEKRKKNISIGPPDKSFIDQNHDIYASSPVKRSFFYDRNNIEGNMMNTSIKLDSEKVPLIVKKKMENDAGIRISFDLKLD